MTLWTWGLELVLVLLLGATLFYAMRLERSIGVLRSDRVGLGEVLATIRIALDDAERSIQTLHGIADVTGRALTREIEAAEQARHDLQFLLGRLDSVADKVETVIRSGRAATAPEQSSSTGTSHSKAERDLLKVLRLSK